MPCITLAAPPCLQSGAAESGRAQSFGHIHMKMPPETGVFRALGLKVSPVLCVNFRVNCDSGTPL